MRAKQNQSSKQILKVRTEERCGSNLTLEPREGQKQGKEAEREVLEHNMSRRCLCDLHSDTQPTSQKFYSPDLCTSIYESANQWYQKN